MNKIGLVIRREFNERVKKRSFLITTLLTPLLMVALIGVTVWLTSRGSSEAKPIEVIDASGLIVDKLENRGTIEYRASTRTLDEINADHPDTWGVLVIGADVVKNPSNVQLYTYSSSTLETESTISRAIEEIIETEKLKSYDIENLSQILADVRTDVTLKAFKVDTDSGEEKESSSGLSMMLAYGFGILMYMFVLLYGVQVMQGVIEEKNSKVLEVIASSVKPFQLMMGKIIGIACVAVTQFVIWIVVIAALGTLVVQQLVPADIMAAAKNMAGGGMAGMTDPAMAEAISAIANPEAVAALGNLMDIDYMGLMLAVFFVYFVGGYLLYAAAFAAVGSAVDNIQDSQQFQMPVTLPIMLGFLGMVSAMNDPNGAVAFWLSIIPFTSPMVMVARIPYGVPGWELALSVGLLVLTFVAMVWLAGKIYRVGILMYGKKPSFAELAKWITYR
ncbi:MAG: ABC transporter permease [Alistipes sp.]|jgi:ABC-2 type transport system permease protein|nr:ABC transporter permease [Alistipes sp.]